MPEKVGDEDPEVREGKSMETGSEVEQAPVLLT
jgi:hypothetical protein